MTNLEMLYDMTFENDISVVNAHFSKTKKAACLYGDGLKAIVLDKPAIKTATEETVILAEEIGHFETRALYVIQATYNTPLARSNRRKYEARANKWAVKKLLPFKDLQAAVDKGISEIWDLAEYFNVTEEFIAKAFNIYEGEGKIDFSENTVFKERIK